MDSLIRTCAISGKEFRISDCEADFCHANDIPLPTLCPDERKRQLFAYQNRRSLYKRTCDVSGKPILSIFSPSRTLNVVGTDLWESDSWDALDYGRTYDFNRPFFEQFASLLSVVPLPALPGGESSRENSDYVSGVSNARNCYLVFGATNVEECLYSQTVQRSRDIIDCAAVTDSELCYECVDIRKCYGLKFSTHCVGCSDSYFLDNCQSCTNCFACVNLSQRSYCYFNEQLTPGGYKERIASHNLGSRDYLEHFKNEFGRWRSNLPHRTSFGVGNEGSSGNYLYSTKNCRDCFFCTESEDLEHCVAIYRGKSSFFHLMFGIGSELVYNSAGCGLNIYNVKFCAELRMNVRDVEYCYYCAYGTHDCFGCVGLRRNEYCILNKQYRPSEYFELANRIRAQMKATGEYGQFFPANFSPHHFNRSLAFERLPLERNSAISRGYDWEDEEQRLEEGISAPPDSIDDASETVLKSTFVCSKTFKGFKIAKSELDFLQRERIALPAESPMHRVERRSKIFRIDPLRECTCSKCAGLTLSPYIEATHLQCDKCFLSEAHEAPS